MARTNLARRGFFPRVFDDDWDNMTDSLFSPYLRSQYIPSCNVRESGDSFIVELDAPGRDKNDFEVKVENNNLIIRSEKEDKKEETGEQFTRREFNISKFERHFPLGENINAEKIEASYKNGILEVRLPKKISAKAVSSKNIPIR